MTAEQLQRMLDRAGMSQVGAARDLGVSDRNMRRYIAGDLPVPQVVELALRRLIEQSTKHVVGIDELTPRELEWFSAAVDVARGATWSRETFIHCEPVRDGKGRFCELRARDHSNLQRLLAVIPIDKKGVPQAAERPI